MIERWWTVIKRRKWWNKNRDELLLFFTRMKMFLHWWLVARRKRNEKEDRNEEWEKISTLVRSSRFWVVLLSFTSLTFFKKNFPPQLNGRIQSLSRHFINLITIKTNSSIKVSYQSYQTIFGTSLYQNFSWKILVSREETEMEMYEFCARFWEFVLSISRCRFCFSRK